MPKDFNALWREWAYTRPEAIENDDPEWLAAVIALRDGDDIEKHYGPGPHPGTGTDQTEHAGGRGASRPATATLTRTWRDELRDEGFDVRPAPRLLERLNSLIREQRSLARPHGVPKMETYMAERPDGGLQRLYNPEAWHRPEHLHVCGLCGGLVAKQTDDRWIHLNGYENMGKAATDSTNRFKKLTGVTWGREVSSMPMSALASTSPLMYHNDVLQKYPDLILPIDEQVQADLTAQQQADSARNKDESNAYHERKSALDQLIAQEVEKVYPQVFEEGARLRAAINSHVGPNGEFAKPLSTAYDFNALAPEELDRVVAKDRKLIDLRQQLAAADEARVKSREWWTPKKEWLESQQYTRYADDPHPLVMRHPNDVWMVPRSALTPTGKLKASVELENLNVVRVPWDSASGDYEPFPELSSPDYVRFGVYGWSDMRKAYWRREYGKHNKVVLQWEAVDTEFRREVMSALTAEQGLTKQQATLREIGRLRSMGGKIETTNSRGKGVEIAEKWNHFFPTDWIENSSNITINTRQGRAHYSAGTLKITDALDDWLHEMGHHYEITVPAISALERKFYNTRTSGGDPVPLKRLFPGHRYGNDEYSIPDDFGHAYMGKSYPGGHYELLSMGLPIIYGASGDKMDDEMTNFIFGLLAEA